MKVYLCYENHNEKLTDVRVFSSIENIVNYVTMNGKLRMTVEHITHMSNVDALKHCITDSSYTEIKVYTEPEYDELLGIHFDGKVERYWIIEKQVH